MILPTFTYCGILQLKLAATQANRLASFYDRLLRIILGNSSTKPAIQSVENANNIRACKLVHKCLDREANENFQGYFEVQDHKIETSNLYLLKLPKIRTEYARKSFCFNCDTVYKSFPSFVQGRLISIWASPRPPTFSRYVCMFSWL